MRTGCIRHPENDLIIMRRGWQIKAFTMIERPSGPKKDSIAECGAELLSIFEYHYDNPMANRIMREEFQRITAKRPTGLHPFGGWLPYSRIYLRDMFHKSRDMGLIMRSVDAIKGLGFVSTEVPSDITSIFKVPYTWIKFEPDTINAWIDAHMPRSWTTEWKPREIIPVRAAEPDVQTETPEMSRSAVAWQICEFHRHIHNKNATTIYAGKRHDKVMKQLTLGRSVAQCSQAILGCRVSDWHQGKHPKNESGKVYDDISLLFRDAIKFEQFQDIAIENGITEEIAEREFKAFLIDGASQYTKRPPKTAQTASNEPQMHVSTLTDSEKRRYRELATSVASFFITNTPVPEIVQFVKESPSTQAYNEGITDVIAFEKSLTDAVKVYMPDGMSQSIEQNIRKFALVFVRMQQLKQQT